ncbi:hypothetical protein FQN57_000080 [Myotisia sp. PD_48]|nr:hypothetical protein FQN57_000080 [Myotisia sp. PD_48]
MSLVDHGGKFFGIFRGAVSGILYLIEYKERDPWKDYHQHRLAENVRSRRGPDPHGPISGPFKIGGVATTSDGLALAAYSGRLYALHRGANNTEIHCTSSNDAGISWAGWHKVADGNATNSVPRVLKYTGIGTSHSFKLDYWYNDAKATTGVSMAVHDDRQWLCYGGNDEKALFEMFVTRMVDTANNHMPFPTLQLCLTPLLLFLCLWWEALAFVLKYPLDI